MHRVVFAPSADRQIRKLPAEVQSRIAAKIAAISEDPYGVSEGFYRKRGCLKVRTGAHRILYDVDDDSLVVNILRIADRREVYSKKHRA